MNNKRLLNVGLIVLVDMPGFSSGLESPTREVMPSFASYLLGVYGPSLAGWMAASVMLFMVSYAFFRLINKSGVVTAE